jgi:hypothetical protein
MKSLKLLSMLFVMFLFSMLCFGQEKEIAFDKLFSKSKPVVQKRGVHMHLTGLAPTADRFVGLLKILKCYKVK